MLLITRLFSPQKAKRDAIQKTRELDRTLCILKETIQCNKERDNGERSNNRFDKDFRGLPA